MILMIIEDDGKAWSLKLNHWSSFPVVLKPSQIKSIAEYVILTTKVFSCCAQKQCWLPIHLAVDILVSRITIKSMQELAIFMSNTAAWYLVIRRRRKSLRSKGPTSCFQCQRLEHVSFSLVLFHKSLRAHSTHVDQWIWEAYYTCSYSGVASRSQSCWVLFPSPWLITMTSNIRTSYSANLVWLVHNANCGRFLFRLITGQLIISKNRHDDHDAWICMQLIGALESAPCWSESSDIIFCLQQMKTNGNDDSVATVSNQGRNVLLLVGPFIRMHWHSWVQKK